MGLNLHRSEFLTSAVNADGYPRHGLKEIALVGRSNVGKSSLINSLVNRKKFARTSNQPGRTQTINFYQVDYLCLVDLPGYGYAKAPARVRQQWQPMIEDYLLKRSNLVGVLHLVDIRHKPTQDDQLMHRWLLEMNKNRILIATKVDKISRGRYGQHVKNIRDVLQADPILFSTKTGQGRQQVLSLIEALT